MLQVRTHQIQVRSNARPKFKNMAPSRVRGLGEDSRFEASCTREKQVGGSVASKGRRNGNSTVLIGSTLKDVTIASTAAASTQQVGQDGSGGVRLKLDIELSNGTLLLIFCG